MSNVFLVSIVYRRKDLSDKDSSHYVCSYPAAVFRTYNAAKGYANDVVGLYNASSEFFLYDFDIKEFKVG